MNGNVIEASLESRDYTPWLANGFDRRVIHFANVVREWTSGINNAFRTDLELLTVEFILTNGSANAAVLQSQKSCRHLRQKAPKYEVHDLGTADLVVPARPSMRVATNPYRFFYAVEFFKSFPFHRE